MMFFHHFSNDFIFHVAANEAGAKKLSGVTDPTRDRRALAAAIAKGNVSEVKRLIRNDSLLNRHEPESGLTPLNEAAFHGEQEILKLLLDRGARVSHPSRDGNTALHTAAFLCRTEMVELLLDRGASTETKNARGETPIDVVSGEWSEPLAGFYRVLDGAGSLSLDLDTIRKSRPEIATLLRNHARNQQ